MKKYLCAVGCVALMLAVNAAEAKKDAYDIRPEDNGGKVLNGVEWENANDAALRAATADEVLEGFVATDEASAALLAGVKGAYASDPLVLRQIAAVSQYVMLDGAWYEALLFWSDSRADQRKRWVKALVTTAENSSDDYVKTFCLDQLRWCGCDCPCLLGRLRALAAKSSKPVADFAAVVLRELEGRAIGLR